MWVKGEFFRNLDDVGTIARGTLDRGSQQSLFDRLDWFKRTLATVPLRGKPLIVRARGEGSDAWLFLMQDSRHATALTSWYSLAFAPVFTGSPDLAARQALLTAIARRLRWRADVLTLAPLDSETCDILAIAFDRGRWISIKRQTSVNWTVWTKGLSFADYWSARPGELRSTVARKQAKFGVTTRVVTGFDAEVWAAYEAIYADSWKPQEGSLPFLRDMAEHESAAGTLRMGLAMQDGVAVAAQLWTVENGHAIIHKLAHRNDAKKASPGSILTAAMFAHVLDTDHVDLVDFGTGDDPYKADWMDGARPLYTLSLFNAFSIRGLFGALRMAMATLVGRKDSR